MLGLTNFISTCFTILLRQITKPDTLTLLFILLFFFYHLQINESRFRSALCFKRNISLIHIVRNVEFKN